MRHLTIKSLATAALIIFGLSHNTDASVHQYTIDIDEDLASAKVKICFDGSPPRYLSVESKLGSKDLIKLPHSKHGNIEVYGTNWKTQNLPADACLNYQVSIKRYKAKHTKLKLRSKKMRVSYIEDNTWLWLPEKIDEQDNIELLFNLPTWAEISTPWHQVNASEQRFLLGHSPQEWGYSILLGDFDMAHYPISKEATLNVASIRGMKKEEELHQWLQDTAKALENYLGKYPVRDTQVIVIPKTKKKHGPVPWGRLLRGNGMGILFVVIPDLPMEDFYTDWTATHEFSHLLIPNLEWDNKWLSEGLASYLEYVLMAQSEWISKEKAWLGIYKGLQRGQKGTEKLGKETLRATARTRGRSHRGGSTMRIYWSGALFFIKADLALRQQSNNKVGLNDILLKLNRCCVNHTKIWSGSFFAQKLDDLSNSKIFTDLYGEFWNSRSYPEYESTMKELGVLVDPRHPEELKLEKNSLAALIME